MTSRRLVGHVSCLQMFPVKSCKGVKLDSTRCYYEGLHNDRRWAVVDDESGQCLSMDRHPSMCFIRPHLQDNSLCMEAPGLGSLTISLPLQSQDIRDVQVGENGTCGKGRSAGPKAKEWISSYLKTECSIFQLTESRHLISHRYGALARKGDKTGFALFAPVLVATTEALDDLNKDTETPFSMDRFRASIIISGTTSHEEDNWRNLCIGDDGPQLRFLKRCGRCPVTTVDPEIGLKTGQEPLKTLRKTRLPLPENRKTEGYSPIFGIYFAVDKEGPIRVGDPVYECSDGTV